MNTYSAASAQADHVSQSRKCNRAYASILMQRQLPGMVLFLRNVAASITDALAILGSTFQRFVPLAPVLVPSVMSNLILPWSTRAEA